MLGTRKQFLAEWRSEYVRKHDFVKRDFGKFWEAFSPIFE